MAAADRWGLVAPSQQIAAPAALGELPDALGDFGDIRHVPREKPALDGLQRVLLNEAEPAHWASSTTTVTASSPTPPAFWSVFWSASTSAAPAHPDPSSALAR